MFGTDITDFGTIFDAELDNYEFVFTPILPDGRMIELLVGEILAMTNELNDDLFLCRITKIGHGQNKDYSIAVARQINSSRTKERGPETQKLDKIFRANNMNQLFFVAHCEPLGIVKKNGTFAPPKTVPFYFSSVSKVDEDNFPQDLRDKLGNLVIGKLRSGSTVLNIDAGLYTELLPYHLGVFAVTGKGKSNAIRRVCGGLLETMGRHTFVIFEPHGDYIKHLRKHPLAGEYLRIYRNKGADEPNINRIRIAYSDITVDMLLMVKDYLGWTDAQIRLLNDASWTFDDWFERILHFPLNQMELEERAEKGDFDYDSLSLDDDDKEPKTLKECFPDYGEDTLKAIRSKLRQLQTAPYMVREKDASNLHSILNHIHGGRSILIDMGSLTGLKELFLSTVVSSSVLSHNIGKFEKDEDMFAAEAPTVNIIMEEAQRVLGEDVPKNSIFASIVNEGRKYKVGFIAITQQPKNMSGKIMSQFNTLIILGITDEIDFGILKGKSAKAIEKLRHEIKSLAPGEAIISTAHSPFAVPVQIDLYEIYLEEARKRYENKEKGLTSKSFKGFFEH